MNIVIVTGMSGSGKTVSLKLLEDMGYYCVDNIPVELIDELVNRFLSFETGIKNLAIGIDIRCGESLFCLLSLISKLKKDGMKVELLFLDASNICLVNRYKETRRSHPLSINSNIINLHSNSDNIDDLVNFERNILKDIKAQSDYIIDTDGKLIRDLKQELNLLFNNENNKFNIRLRSFGFMYGLPNDSDLVFDVRFLPNPFYINELKNKTGEDIDVSNFAINNDDGKQFIKQLYDMLLFLIPRYISEGKSGLVVSIGCTGGKHRSVAVAKKIYDLLNNSKDINITLVHKDKDKN